MDSKYPSNGKSIEQRYYDYMPPNDQELAKQTFRISFIHLITGSIFLTGAVSAAVLAWSTLNNKQDSLQIEQTALRNEQKAMRCELRQVIDVVIYKQSPRQPNC